MTPDHYVAVLASLTCFLSALGRRGAVRPLRVRTGARNIPHLLGRETPAGHFEPVQKIIKCTSACDRAARISHFEPVRAMLICTLLGAMGKEPHRNRPDPVQKIIINTPFEIGRIAPPIRFGHVEPLVIRTLPSARKWSRPNHFASAWAISVRTFFGVMI